MKKPTKTKLIKQADDLWSRAIRARDKRCLRCGTRENLQAAHIFSRAGKSTRWDLRNGITLCWQHHFHWAHKQPIEFTEFVREHLGSKKFKELCEKHLENHVWGVKEIQDIIIVLKELLKTI